MDLTSLSEQDIRTKFITPAIAAAGWDLRRQLREEVPLTAGRVIVRGKQATRAPARRADYVLYHRPGVPIAVVEAKDATHTVGDGIQQALAYARLLDVPFAFASNGTGFVFHDGTRGAAWLETELAIDAFPSPEELWRRWCTWKGLDAPRERLVTQPYHDDGSGKEPRYYQRVAIDRTVEAVARGQDRILLVMATGTGKTYTAFQVIWRLWKAGVKQRILFLADRNILVDQTKANDFKPFGQAMTKITGRQVDKSYEIYLALYQAVTGSDEEKNVYRQFSPDFFDLVVVDECHRGSAAADAAWREVLDYFGGATQIGLTATPKETASVSNIHYFGTPVYTYSLRQGIDDGFLAPYKVVRVDLDKDLQGFRPHDGQRDKHGEVIEDGIYGRGDFDRTLVLEERTRLVARKVTEYLKATDRRAKTIVFCVDQDHAARMRTELANLNADLMAVDSRYVMRITGEDDEGKRQLDAFIDPESPYPVIATTSELLTTGVDAKTCKVIVIDQPVKSMTKFKQMIGRGTRIDEDHDKTWFTILDFRGVTDLFADPDFDGDPVQVYVPTGDDPIVPPDDGDAATAGGDAAEHDGAERADSSQPGLLPAPDGAGGRKRYVVAGVPVTVLAERVQYIGPDGTLITESLRDYTRKTVAGAYASLDAFLTRWSAEARKETILAELAERGVLLEALEEEVGRDYDPFDLLCHVAFDRPPLTRRERAARARRADYFTKYGPEARAVLDALLEKYADEGVAPAADLDVLRVRPLTMLGSPLEIVRRFGGREGYLAAVRDLERALYGAG